MADPGDARKLERGRISDHHTIDADQALGRFEVGEAVAYESWAMGRRLWAVPVRIVADDDDLIALFATVGTEFQRLVQSNGGRCPESCLGRRSRDVT